eukprot:CAMPEP_0172499732 /NCGR_PEP_ID=MMETSP1066-20121228/130120_1 /TAXON_ID=671091 /ORGANISM="Coscinodiscus wailesii, Strain CCMP2513" /LENGTH=354 /DNA_ID=CAMNT_0013273631 /DNA_START=50 /DNA_END=1111 /DNA_ORIENTATION=-
MAYLISKPICFRTGVTIMIAISFSLVMGFQGVRMGDEQLVDTSVDKSRKLNDVANDTESNNTIQLDDMLTLEYDLNNTDSSVTIKMTYADQGWVSFGFGKGMIGSTAAIGQPLISGISHNPGMYYMATYADDGTTTLPDANQTLINASITYVDKTTVLTFTKLLNDPRDKIPVNISGLNNFLYAYGDTLTLAHHIGSGAFELDFKGGEIAVTEPKFSTEWTAHGLTAFIAWGVLTPLAIAASILRDFIPAKGLWFKIHQYYNALTLFLTVVSFSLAVSTIRRVGLEHFRDRHQIVGLAMFVLVTMQVVGGVLRPGLPPKPVESGGDEDGGNGEEVPKKSSARVAWDYGHKGAGW